MQPSDLENLAIKFAASKNKAKLRTADPIAEGISLHAPYHAPETDNMRYISLIVLIVFGSVYLFIRFILSQIKPTNGDKFFSKAIKLLGNQLLIYFMLQVTLLTLYTFGAFDSIQINWQFIITAIAIFGLSWIIFSIIIIFFCVLVVRKWNELENNAKDFSKII
jgi:cytochrome c biogenesis factor